MNSEKDGGVGRGGGSVGMEGDGVSFVPPLPPVMWWRGVLLLLLLW